MFQEYRENLDMLLWVQPWYAYLNLMDDLAQQDCSKCKILSSSAMSQCTACIDENAAVKVADTKMLVSVLVPTFVFLHNLCESGCSEWTTVNGESTVRISHLFCTIAGSIANESLPYRSHLLKSLQACRNHAGTLFSILTLLFALLCCNRHWLPGLNHLQSYQGLVKCWRQQIVWEL